MRFLLILCCLSILSNSGAAALIHYDESVDGDLGVFAPLKHLSLDVGNNTVAGTIGLNIFMVGNDFDSFAITIPDDTQLIGFAVALEQSPLESAWRITTDGNPGGTVLDLVRVNGGSMTSSTAVPIGPGTYSVDHAGMSSGVPGRVPYLFTLTVESTKPIPEPSSLALLGIGGLTLLGYRRRRKRSRRP